jgi:YesN/AraC family two-component response regulator
MDISKINIEYAFKNGLYYSDCNGLQHTKALPYLSVVQAIEGNYDIQLGGGAMYNTEDKGFFIAPSDIQQRIIHHTDKKSGKMRCRWVFLKVKINEIYSFDDLYSLPVILPESYKKQMNGIFDRLFSVSDVFQEYICYYEIIKLLSSVGVKKEPKKPSVLYEILSYIKSNYKDKIEIEDLAKNHNISSSYLFYLFKKQTGVSPISYLNSYRLSIAAELLLTTSKTIVEISAYVGIYDSVYFNKIFKKYTNLLPSAFRK